jgi:hypothetical protein
MFPDVIDEISFMQSEIRAFRTFVKFLIDAGVSGMHQLMI